MFHQALALRSGQFLLLVQPGFEGLPCYTQLIQPLIHRSTLLCRLCQLRLKLIHELPKLRYLGQCETFCVARRAPPRN